MTSQNSLKWQRSRPFCRDFQTSIFNRLDHVSTERLLWMCASLHSHPEDPWVFLVFVVPYNCLFFFSRHGSLVLNSLSCVLCNFCSTKTVPFWAKILREELSIFFGNKASKQRNPNYIRYLATKEIKQQNASLIEFSLFPPSALTWSTLLSASLALTHQITPAKELLPATKRTGQNGSRLTNELHDFASKSSVKFKPGGPNSGAG